VNSDDGALTDSSKYLPTEFPNGVVIYNQQQAQWLDDSTGAVWFGINQGHDTWGHVFTSGSKGLRYTTSMPHVYAYSGVRFPFIYSFWTFLHQFLIGTYMSLDDIRFLLV
jgi:hypothetical protein